MRLLIVLICASFPIAYTSTVIGLCSILCKIFNSFNYSHLHGRVRTPADGLSQKKRRGDNRWEATMVQNDTKWINVQSDCLFYATCIQTSSQNLPIWANEATEMTRVKRNNSNPLRILRLYNTDILWQKIKTERGEKRPGWGVPSERKNTRKLS